MLHIYIAAKLQIGFDILHLQDVKKAEANLPWLGHHKTV